MTATLEQLKQLETAEQNARESLKNEMTLELGRLRADFDADVATRIAGLLQKVQDTMHVPMVQRAGVIEDDVTGLQKGMKTMAEDRESLRTLVKQVGDKLIAVAGEVDKLKDSMNQMKSSSTDGSGSFAAKPGAGLVDTKKHQHRNRSVIPVVG